MHGKEINVAVDNCVQTSALYVDASAVSLKRSLAGVRTPPYRPFINEDLVYRNSFFHRKNLIDRSLTRI